MPSLTELNRDSVKHLRRALFTLPESQDSELRPNAVAVRNLILDTFGRTIETRSALRLFDPAQSVENPAQLAIWPDAQARAIGEKKRLRGKPGRVIRRIFPMADESQIAEFAESFKESFVANAGLEFAIGKASKDFARVYSMQIADYANPCTSHYRKSLANSCMRATYGDWDDTNHPARVFGSGDFHIAYVTQGGLLAARCVIYSDSDGTFHPGPIYGCSDSAMDKIQVYLDSQNVARHASWCGAELLAIRNGWGDSYVMPYLDMEQGLELHGDRFVIVGNHGEYQADETNGTTNGLGICCDRCGDRCGDYESEYNARAVGDETWCEHCHCHYSAYCEDCEESFPSDDAVTVSSYARDGIEHQRTCCEYCARNAVETESDGMWIESDTVETVCGEIHPAYSDNIVYSELMGETILASDAERSDSGEYATRDWYEESGWYCVDGTWQENDPNQMEMEI